MLVLADTAKFVTNLIPCTKNVLFFLFCALYILNFEYDTDTSVGVNIGIDKYLA